MKTVHAARIAAHQSNIKRYRRLLATYLTPLERQYLENRLAEEQAALAELRSHGIDRPPAALAAATLARNRGGSSNVLD